MQASDIAWQPLTPRGVAAFSRARLGHLLILQLVVALVVAGTLVWFLKTAWFPVVTSAIQQLPAEGSIRSRNLVWPGDPATLLAENHFLSFAVDLRHEGQVRAPAHVQVEFGARDVRVFSLLGLSQASYPAGWTIAFNRPQLVPWWGAWSPAILAIAALATIASLFLSWFLLSCLYCPVAWLIGFFADRQLTMRGAWRLCGAALMPGALFLIAAIFLYGFGVLDVVRLLAAMAAHFLIGWIYLITAPFWCPRHPQASPPAGNPFSGVTAPAAKTEPAPQALPALPKPPKPPPATTRNELLLNPSSCLFSVGA